MLSLKNNIITPYLFNQRRFYQLNAFPKMNSLVDASLPKVMRNRELISEISTPSPIDPYYFPKEINSETTLSYLKLLDNYRKSNESGYPEIHDFLYDLLKRKVWVFGNRIKSIRERELWNINFKNIPMNYSLYDLPEIHDFYDINRHKYLLEPIYDSMEFEAYYSDSQLIKAKITNNQGKEIDITNLVRNIENFPRSIKNNSICKVSGYLVINNFNFNQFNTDRFLNGLNTWINVRSAINNILSADTPNREYESKIKAYVHDLEFQETNKKIFLYNYRKSILRELERNNFKTHDHFTSLFFANELIGRQKEWETNSQLSLLGYKVSINDLNFNNKFKDKKYLIAPKIRDVKIKKIQTEVEENGLVTLQVHTEDNYTLLFSDPKPLENKQIAAGHSIRILDAKNYLGIVNCGQSKVVIFPFNCPQCNSRLTKKSGPGLFCEAHSYCESSKDSKIQEIMNFFSKTGLYVPSLTEKKVGELLKNKLIFEIEDMFTLSRYNIPGDEKLLLELDLVRHTSLKNFISALNIPGINYLRAEKLAYEFGTISNFLKISKLENKIIHDYIVLYGTKINGILKYLTISEPHPDVIKYIYSKEEIQTSEEYDKLKEKLDKSQQEGTYNDWEFDQLSSILKNMTFPDGVPLDELKKQSKSFPVSPIFEDQCDRIRKSYSIKDLEKFLMARKEKFIVQPKIDGIAFYLTYSNGVLTKVATKNQTFNRDIFKYFKIVENNIPQKISHLEKITIRGELYLTEQLLAKINKRSVLEGKRFYSDSLALLTAQFSKDNLDIEILNELKFFPFDFIGDKPEINQETLISFLRKLGFSFPAFGNQCFENVEDLVGLISDVEVFKNRFPFSIDGAVIKYDRNPKNMFYLKHNIESLDTIILDVIFNIDRNGFLIMRILLEPVKFSNGRIASQVILYNAFNELDVCIGGLAKISLKGGSFPYLISVKRNKDQELVTIPTKCPLCSEKLDGSEKLNSVRCVNVRCDQSKEHKELLYFSEVMGFEEIATKKLIENNYIYDYASFYSLTKKDFNNHVFSEHQIESLLYKIEISKIAPLDRVLRALNIFRRNKENTFTKVVNIYPNLESLLEGTIKDFIKKGLSRDIAKRLYSYLAKPENKKKLLHFSKTIGFDKSKKSLSHKDLDKINVDFSKISLKVDELRKLYIDKIEEKKKKRFEILKEISSADDSYERTRLISKIQEHKEEEDNILKLLKSHCREDRSD